MGRHKVRRRSGDALAIALAGTPAPPCVHEGGAPRCRDYGRCRDEALACLRFLAYVRRADPETLTLPPIGRPRKDGPPPPVRSAATPTREFYVRLFGSDRDAD